MPSVCYKKHNTILIKMYPGEAVPKTLPKEFRGSIFNELDMPFLFILGIFFIAYIALVSSFSKVKPREEIRFDQVPERFARLILDKPIVIKKKKIINIKKTEPKKVKGATKTGKKVRTKTKTIKRNVKGSKRRGGGRIITKQDAAEMVRTAGIIGIIGSRGKKGAVADLFAEKGFNKKLDQALKGVAGLKSGRTLSEARMKRGGGKAKGIDIGKLKSTTGSGAVAFGAKNVSAVNVLGNLGEDDIQGEGTINPGIIAKTLAKHIGAFQYCYNKALRSNPRLNGELRVQFTIKVNGVVESSDIAFGGPASKDKNLSSCVFRVFRRIRFPKPKGGEVRVNYPLNFTAQN